MGGSVKGWVRHEGPFAPDEETDLQSGYAEASSENDPATDFKRDKKTGLWLPEGARAGQPLGFRAKDTR